MTASSPLFVLWKAPSSELEAGATVLSFLTPREENELVASGTAKDVVTMSRVMDAVSEEARGLYLEIVADIGLFELPDGRTLREAARGRGKASQWWYHPVAFRDSEGDPTYTNILSVLAIVREARARAAGSLHLVHPPRGVAEVLSSRFEVSIEGSSGRPEWLVLLRNLLGRVRLVLRAIETKLALKRYYRCPGQKLEVALQGYWDWSVYPDGGAGGRFIDRYFGRLAEELRACGKRVGYWCWYDPWSRPGEFRSSHEEVLVPLRSCDNVVVLQSLLTLRDMIAAALDFRSLRIFLSVARQRGFREIFSRHGLDFYPLFRLHLFSGCVRSAIPICLLVEQATTLAQASTNPGLMICFQEHFPVPRAMYGAVRGSGTRAWAVQHASYSRGKTYGALQPQKEFAPHQDGESIPRPDRICVMGKHGRQLFRDCGYGEDQILLTGSTRYDHVALPAENRIVSVPANAQRGRVNVLVATSIPASVEFLLAEAAVEAVKGLEDCVFLRLRQHPFDLIEAQPGYARLAPWLEVSANSLEEDFAWADLVLMSQSTVGEEAILAGKPVWQFRFPHPDRSALAEVTAIPRYYTVAELRNGLQEFTSATAADRPGMPVIEEVYHALFQTTPEKPSVAIAEAICVEF